MSPDHQLEEAVLHPLQAASGVLQRLVDLIISSRPPAPDAVLRRPRIAVIGAGITGVTAAAHCVGHGFDVCIFEAGSAEKLGGIWSVGFLLVTPLDKARG